MLCAGAPAATPLRATTSVKVRDLILHHTRAARSQPGLLIGGPTHHYSLAQLRREGTLAVRPPGDSRTLMRKSHSPARALCQAPAYAALHENGDGRPGRRAASLGSYSEQDHRS